MSRRVVSVNAVVKLVSITGDYSPADLPYLQEILRADYRGQAELIDEESRYSLVAFTFPHGFDQAEVPKDGKKFLWVSWYDLAIVGW